MSVLLPNNTVCCDILQPWIQPSLRSLKHLLSGEQLTRRYIQVCSQDDTAGDFITYAQEHYPTKD